MIKGIGFGLLLTIIICGCFFNSHAANRDSLIVDLSYGQSTPSDSLRLYMGDVFLYDKSPDCFYPEVKGKKRFRFAIPVNAECGYFWFTVKRRTSGPGDMQIIGYQFWETGDSIRINVSHRETNAGIYATSTFSGKGALKYTLWEKMNKIHMEQMVETKGFNGNIIDGVPDSLSLTQNAQLRFLEQNRNLVSPLSYNVFRANLLYSAFNQKMARIEVFLREHKLNKQDSSLFIDGFKKRFYPLNIGGIADGGLSSSFEFVAAASRAFHLLGQLDTTGRALSVEFNEIVNSGLSKDVQEALIINYFLRSGRSQELKSIYDSACKLFVNENNLSLLRQIWLRNSEVPANVEFTKLNGEKLKLSDLKGKIVLIDLWFNGCGGCAVYYANVLSKLEHSGLLKKGIEVLSINVDKSPLVWKTGLKGGLYSSDNAINVFTNGLAFNHPFIKAYDIQWLPTVMLIDKKGKIVSYNSSELLKYDSLVELLEKLI